MRTVSGTYRNHLFLFILVMIAQHNYMCGLILTNGKIFLKAHEFTTASIYDLLKTYPEIEYTKCHDAQLFEFKPFPISKFPELQPHKGLLAETFILNIPNGQAGTSKGYIKSHNKIISELIPQSFSLEHHLQLLLQYNFEHITKIKGRVAIITALYDSGYFHWIFNVLGRLALLEMYNISYDWLYVAHDLQFMQESLALWGIDPAKIITPFGNTKYIQADELIVPSLIGARIPQPHEYVLNWVPLDYLCTKWNLDPKSIYLYGNSTNKATDVYPDNISFDTCFLRWTPLLGCYLSPDIIHHIRNKLLASAKLSDYDFSKRVFISRKDAGLRGMINEDEIFALFEPYGFKRYCLQDRPVIEQIALFHGAEIVVAAHGASLTNLIFSQPNTTIIEIFQERSDCTFYYYSQLLKLNHHCIKTTEFKDIWGHSATNVPAEIIQEFITEHISIFEKKDE